MRTTVKENIQVYTAIAMLASGVALSVAGFVVEPTGQIHDSVLWYFAQTLIYAGSIFGISIYANARVNGVIDKITKTAKNDGNKE
jgi:hypothetical protein